MRVILSRYVCPALIGLVLLAGGRTAGAQTMLTAGNRSLTMEEVISMSWSDLADHWAQAFREAGWSFEAPVSLSWYDSPVITSCGEALMGNAFYCTIDHSIYYDVTLMRAIFGQTTYGDFGALTIMAHEYAHAVQARMPDHEVFGLPMRHELQADCLSGVYAKFLSEGRSTRLRLEEGDIEEGATLLYDLGDDLPWFDPDAHGTPYDRSLHFLIGLAEGIDACRPAVRYEDPEGAFAIAHPRGWTVAQDGRWSPDRSTYIKSFLTAPPGAEQADLHGYLSEGIRITMELPPKGRMWTDAHRARWSSTVVRDRLRVNPAFRVVDSTAVVFAGASGMRYELEGTADLISEPERTSFIKVAEPGYLMLIEMSSPASEYTYYQHRLHQIVDGFLLQTPAAPDLPDASDLQIMLDPPEVFERPIVLDPPDELDRPYTSPPVSPGASGVVRNVWVEHDVWEYDMEALRVRRGMRIHASVEVSNLANREVQLAAYFLRTDGVALVDPDGRFATGEGKVAVSENLKVWLDRNTWDDAALFIPYEELHMGPGQHRLEFYLQVWDMSGTAPAGLARTERMGFTLVQ